MARWTMRPGSRGMALLVIALACWLMATGGQAQEGRERPDVRVVIDVSGSMKENDPDNLGSSALEMLVSLLPRDVSAGIWTFGERIDNPLPLGRVDAEWRDQALAVAPRLAQYQHYTDIEAALRRAAQGSGAHHLVLLTDGVIDLPPERGDKPAIDAASRRRLIEELAPALAERGVTVHAVAFSDQADLAMVERLSQLTGGLSSLVQTPDSLLGAFLDIFERIFPADQVPISAGRFVIDAQVESFSALLFHEPGGEPLALHAPDGRTFRAGEHGGDIRWRTEPRFDWIQVPDPLPGEWHLEGAIGEASRISVDSPLSLRTGPLPTTLYLGFPLSLSAWLERDGEPLDAQREAFTVTVELRDTAGHVQAAMALEKQTGRFIGELPAPALTGNARLVIRAQGDGVQRQRIQAVNVLPAIGVVHDPIADRVVLRAEHPRLNRDNTELRGEIQGESHPAEAVAETRWHLPLPDLDENVSVPLLLSARVTLDGRVRQLRLPRLVLHPDADIGLDLARQASPTLAAERLETQSAERKTAKPSAGIADRFISLVNALPARLTTLWHEGAPGLARLARQPDRGHWAWAGLLLASLLLLWWGVRVHRQRRRQHLSRREEPHV